MVKLLFFIILYSIILFYHEIFIQFKIGWRLSTAWNYVCKCRPESAPLRDNRSELLKFETSIFSKNSMIEAHARLIEIPVSKSPNIIVRLATGSLDEAAQCLNIYTPIVYDTTITFEVIPPTVEVIFFSSYSSSYFYLFF